MKTGYCPIEKIETLFEFFKNKGRKGWICLSSNCSYVSGCYKDIPKNDKGGNK